MMTENRTGTVLLVPGYAGEDEVFWPFVDGICEAINILPVAFCW